MLQRTLRSTLLIFLFSAFFINLLAAETLTLTSPDHRLQLRIEIGEAVTFSLRAGEQVLLAPSTLALEVAGRGVLGGRPILLSSDTTSHRGILKPLVPRKRREIVDAYRQLTLQFRDFRLVFRLYNEGLAYRFETDFPGEIVVKNEIGEYRFPGDYPLYFPREESFITHSERTYLRRKLSEIPPDQFSSVPILVLLPNGYRLAIAESDLQDYPGLYLQGTGGTALRALFPRAVLRVKPGRHPDRDEVVEQRADYLARTRGTRTFPWRIFMVAEDDAALLQNELVYQLAPPCRIEDPSWIRPGKVAWDWWNALNLFNVDFRAGINTATYKYYIDFAARYGLEYVILDEGWSETTDLLKVNPEINLPELCAYARSKKVGIILWALWKTLDNQLEEALDQFVQWGVQGIKVDFMQRDDQWMVNYYWKVAREAARRHLLVDFHGAYKPAGLRRAYPNVLTREGVKGLEHNKWSRDITPEHDAILPFTRMLVGPMDYTPGAMVNAQKENFRIIFNRPMSQGTRCHQLALYVVFESPLQMLADSPSHYLQDPEVMEFLSAVPTVWDETRVLAAQVGDYLVLARRRGEQWFVGGITDWTPRELEISLDFLPPGEYAALIYQDGLNADRYASDYQMYRTTVNSATRMSIKMAPGGGWVMMVIPKN